MGFNQRSANLKNKAVAIALIPAMCLWAALAYLASPSLAVAGAASLYLAITVVFFFWDLRHHPWFWFAMIAVATAHVLVIAKIGLSGVILPSPLLPFLFVAMILDFGAIYIFVTFMERLTKKS